MQKLSLTLSSVLFFTSSLLSATLSTQPTSSSLIVYNGGIALVHEERTLKLNKDDTEIIYSDVASTIETDSVNVELPKSLTLYSQQYRFDKLTMSKLLDAHIGKKIQTKSKSYTLLSHNGKDALVKDRKNFIHSVLSRDIIFKTIPDSLITKPSLVWNIKAKESLKAKVSIDYLIKKLSWKSNYILNIHNNTADLSGWITIDNRSGKAYENTQLHLLAGDINRATNPRVNKLRYAKTMAMVQDEQVTHRAHEGYHFYSIPFKVSLANNEKTQIKFMSKNSIAIKRTYSTTLSNPLHLRSEILHNTRQFIEIKSLDTPLPKGVVRTYSQLNAQKILLGESPITHTPKESPIKLLLGQNFDIKVTESIQSSSDENNYVDVNILYSIKNSSNEKKTVELLIPFNRNSTSSINTKKDYQFKHGNLLSFKLIIDANKSEQFNVRFRSKR